MNKNRRQIHELEILSAYLDNALVPTDREELEERLQREPNLRERLENLRRTKMTLGNLPRLRAPHNFTLTPDMVSVRKPRRKPLFTFLRLAASFAAILFVVLVGFELVLGGRIGIGSQLAAEAPMREADTFTAEATPEPLILWGGKEGSGGGQQESVTGYGGAGEYAAEGEEQPEMMEEAAPMEEPIDDEEQAEETIEVGPEEPAISKAGGDVEDGPILGLNPDEGGETLSRSEPQALEQETPQGWPTLRWLQIGLALIALSGAILLWLLRRR